MVSLFNVDVPSLELVSIELYITDVASLDLCSLDLCIRPLGANIQLKKSCSRRFTWSLFTWFGLTSIIIPVPGTCCSSQSWRTTCHYQQGWFCLPHRSKGPACEGTTGENSLGLNLVWPMLTCVLFLFIVVTHGKELHFSGSTMIKAKVLALSLHFHLFWLSQLHFVFVGIHKAMPKTPEKARLEWPAVTLCLFVYWPCRQVPKLLKLQCPSRTGFQWLDLPKRSCVIFFSLGDAPWGPFACQLEFLRDGQGHYQQKDSSSMDASILCGFTCRRSRLPRMKMMKALRKPFPHFIFIFYVYIHIYYFFHGLGDCPCPNIHLTNLSLEKVFTWLTFDRNKYSLDQPFTWLTFERNKYSLDQPFTWQSIHLTDIWQKQVFIWPNFHLTKYSLDWPFTFKSPHLIQLSLDWPLPWQTPFTWQMAVWEGIHLRNISLDLASHLNQCWSALVSLDLFTCWQIQTVHLYIHLIFFSFTFLSPFSL